MNKTYLKLLQEAIDNPEYSTDKLGPDGRKTINVDFDGVVHAYSKGFNTGDIYDKPAVGTEEALHLLSRKYDLICFSARVNADPSGNGREAIDEWLKKYNLRQYFKDITDKKHPSLVIIDDSAVRHTSWKETLEQLKEIGILKEEGDT